MNKFEKLLLGLIILEIPLQIDTHLFFDEHWAQFGAIGGINLSVTTACLAVLYALWSVKYVAHASVFGYQRLTVGIAATTYLALAAISCCVAGDMRMAINGFALLVQAYFIYFYVSNRVSTENDVWFVVTLLLATLIVEGAFLILIQAVGHDLSYGPIMGAYGLDGRPGGTLVSPNAAGSYLALLIPLALAMLVTPVSRLPKALAVLALSVAGVGIVLTLSRGSWLALAIAVVVLFLFAWRRIRFAAWPPVTFLLALLLVGFAFHASVVERFQGDEDNAIAGRVVLNNIAWRIIADYPFLGVGINNGAIMMSKYATSSEFRGEWLYLVHNKYLLEWFELGVFGLAAFAWFLTSTLRTGWQVWTRQTATLSPIALGLTAAIAGQGVHMVFDIFNGRPQIQSLWLCAGLLVAMRRMQALPQSREPLTLLAFPKSQAC